MLGAMAGDIIGSAWEANTVTTTHFQLFPQGACFTDDIVLTRGGADPSRRLSGVEFYKMRFTN